MASGPLHKTDFSHDSWGTITVDSTHTWTAPSDGILYVRMDQASNTSNAYLTLYISEWRLIRLNTYASGHSVTQYIPLCKGDVISYSNSGNLLSYLLQFRSTKIV